MELPDMRIDYGIGAVSDAHGFQTPFEWFRDWLEEAIRKNVVEPNAMMLSTVSESGFPTSRVVLLKAFDDQGFVFFSNYESKKGLQLLNNPHAALLFFWPQLERQVRIEGIIIPTNDTISDEYFHTRPLESRISAVISPQSRPVPSRDFLEKLHHEFMATHGDGNVERPTNLGGYLLIPSLFEFWQGRSNRLHDRIQFDHFGDGWKQVRLAP